ncbi:MAG: Tyrosine-tRNA ligase [Candidatus Jorgensenbacteria bacterium GW2011_GWA1_48_11]|uniref:Tyrosine--tRNA ligase n=1 Tax=Candidatus Jorgensenbacteria bacterium GW2011_GWA1_48_11 TaxID=1618660 RepID=A0A0G1UC30_9BACT|nr:MAG: Tyrosine-tRNA ligase [Candidatus Jorgensenbacteria bacterium GW2011_GWA1_48_11]KKW12156.1 MAG: Tyrosine-tRNA ligase [Candidatus Jorgensenbacteria bacterium GW2011_GWB1_49_9]
MNEIILNRGVEEIITRPHLEAALKSGKKLRVKLGIDPTKSDIHLGHTVILRKLKQFQDAGHKIILIIGDFTAQIGDPSGQSAERQPLTEKEVKYNLKNYIRMAGKVINVKKAEVRYNGEWHKQGLKNFLAMTKAVSISQVMKREDFQKRLNAGGDVTVLESLYAILQGYDSVVIKADVELGGTDQKLNLLMGRRLQRHFGLPEQDIMILPLIEGTDGVRKMSKSYDNYIGLEDEPEEMFGKAMSIPDNLIPKYFTLLTDVDQPKNTGPYAAKMLLAQTLVEMYHGEKTALKAREEFVKIFSKKEMPEELEELKIKNKNIALIDLLLQAGIPSKSEARRLIDQGAVKINEETKTNAQEKISLKGREVLKIGKRRFWKIVG